MEKISVVVATFGDRTHWDLIAQRAINSVLIQNPAPFELIRSHGPTLMDARNDGAKKASGKWLCFLDADDELEPEYFEGMMRCHRQLRYPLVRYVDARHPDKLSNPVELQPINLLDGNYMVIGTLVERKLFNDVGGFSDWPIYEDWDLWIRCWMTGARAECARHSTYRVYNSLNSRNHAPGSMMQEYHDRIAGQYKHLTRGPLI